MATKILSSLTNATDYAIRDGKVAFRPGAFSALCPLRGEGAPAINPDMVLPVLLTFVLRIVNGGTFHWHGTFAFASGFAFRLTGGTSLGLNGGTFYVAVAEQTVNGWTILPGVWENAPDNPARAFDATPARQVGMLAHYLNASQAPATPRLWTEYETVVPVRTKAGRFATNPDGIEGIRQRGAERAGDGGGYCGMAPAGPMRPRT